MNQRNNKNIHGIILLDKPLGLTSNGALQRVKKIFNAKKAGHTGSLDPLATGMLPVCLGEATKFTQFLLESDKKYHVTLKLGVKTTTGDAEGEVTATRVVKDVTLERVVTVTQGFLGAIQQIPPMFSAIKHQGKPLYELARRGIEIERAPRTVQIYDLTVANLEEDNVFFTVHCSKGTYIRTLAEDIGEQLGCGAHVIGLRRTAVSPYHDAKMYTLDALEELRKQHGEAILYSLLLPIESSVQALPVVKLSTSSAFYVRTGQPVMVPHLPTEGQVRLFNEDGFMGVGEILNDGRVAPRRLVSLVLKPSPRYNTGLNLY